MKFRKQFAWMLAACLLFAGCGRAEITVQSNQGRENRSQQAAETTAAAAPGQEATAGSSADAPSANTPAGQPPGAEGGVQTPVMTIPETTAIPIQKTPVTIEIRQVDTADFPHLVLYTNVTDGGGNVPTDLRQSDFGIVEIDRNGRVLNATVEDMYQVLNQAHINIQLVMDASGSMETDNKIYGAKNAAAALVNYAQLGAGDQIGVISFDDYVYLTHDFSSDASSLSNAIYNIRTGNMTALYDAIYSGLLLTNDQQGAKCVIAFTDGMENYSSYSFSDVVYLAKNTGIPVFIIGIGDPNGDIDEPELRRLVQECSGRYYNIYRDDIEAILEDIYLNIYREQQNYYVIRYTSSNQDDTGEFRRIRVQSLDGSAYEGTSAEKEYVPVPDLSGAFSATYAFVDQVFPWSSQREVTDADMRGKSLAELRIARNEIFARHGRQFKDLFLNQWFYSKQWYLSIPVKYSPETFENLKPYPISSLEMQNAQRIQAYEDAIMASQDIYPDAGQRLLTDYDLALRRAVLEMALQQMQRYPSTAILNENIARITAAIAKATI